MHRVLELLEKNLFVIIKVICVIMILCKVLSAVIFVGCEIIAFVEGVFAKFSAFITWQQILILSLCLK